MNFSETVHQLGGQQARAENISLLLRLTLHRPRLRRFRDLQPRGLAEQTGQARPIQLELGDNGLTVVK